MTQMNADEEFPICENLRNLRITLNENHRYQF